MDGLISLVIDYEGEKLVFSATKESKFQQIYSAVCGKWPIVNSKTCSLRYSVAGIDNCCLDNDNDVVSMFILARQLCTAIVHVKLVCSGTHSGDKDGTERVVSPGSSFSQHPSFNQMAASTIGATEMPNNPLKRKVPAYEKANSYPTFDVCPPKQDKPLMTDNWDASITGIGQEFPGGAKEFRESLIKYSAVNGFKYNFLQNGKRRIYVVCNKKFGSEACNWFIRASECKGNCEGFVINDAELNHQCETVVGAHVTERLGAEFMGNLIESELRDNPKMGGKDVKRLFKEAYGMDISYKQAWRALECARDKISESFEESV